MRKIFLLAALALTFSSAFAQDSLIYNIEFKDYTYSEDIKSVTFHIDGLPMSYPILNLDSEYDKLVLHFDVLTDDVRSYNYTIIHCDENGTPTDLSNMEYIDGYTEDEIFNYNQSSGTYVSYINYRLDFPNENMRPILSGNYILVVYDWEEPNQPILTRKFYVAEPKVNIDARVVKPSTVKYGISHQEIEMEIDHKGFSINDPFSHINVNIMQNGRTDNMITDVQPRYVREEKLIYDSPDELLFEGAKEFRYFDIRSLLFKTDRISDLATDYGKNTVNIAADEIRSFKQYDYNKDANGNFLIELKDSEDGHIEGDYAKINFTLNMNAPFYGYKVYLIGEFTDWSIKEDFLLTYNDETSAYETTTLLKQGYYNYMYVLVDENGNVSHSSTEGNHFETENDYLILVYHKEPGDRYTKLIGYSVANYFDKQ